MPSAPLAHPAPRPARRHRATRPLVRALVGFLLAAGLVSGSVAQAADDPDAAKRSVDAQLQALRDQLHDTEAGLAAAYLALKETEAKLPGAQADLAKTQAQVDLAQAAKAQADADLKLAQANEKKAEDELADTMAQITAGRGKVATLASQIYMEQGLTSLTLAVNADSPQQLADRLTTVGAVTDVQNSALTRLATARANLTAQESRLSALRADSEKAKAKAEQAVAATTTARDAAAAAKASLDRLATDQRQQSEQVQAKLAGQRDRESQLQAESDRLSEVLKERAAAAQRAAAQNSGGASTSSQPAQDSGGTFTWPNPGGEVTSEFGWRIHPITGVGRLHSGIDIATPCGTPIVAGASGTIVSAGWAGGYGNRVVIDHGMLRGVPVATSYNHMQSIAVSGGAVSRGQVIGYEGTTGFSTGCHLHFEVYVNGTPVNPRGWL